MVSADELRRRGLAAARSGEFRLAADYLTQALQVDPAHGATHVNLSAVYQALKEPRRALEHADRALALGVTRPEIHNNRAMALNALHRFAESIDSASRAIALRPDYPEAYNNLGVAWHGAGELSKAVVGFRQALALRPDYDKALANLGAALQACGQFEEALVCFERALTLKPDADELAGLVLHLRMRLCRWQGLEARLTRLRRDVERGLAVAPPFAVLSLFDDPALHRQAALLEACKHREAHPKHREVAIHQKIRVGYFSADFYNHATTHLIAGLIAAHDRERFEILGFSFGPQKDDSESKRIRERFDRFFECRSMSDDAVAEQARTLALDIAVDLKGYTQDSRPGIFAAQAAPVQVNFLGYPGTMSAAFMHYLIGDEVVIPPEHRQHYDERVVFMPYSYQVNDAARERPSPDRCPSRVALGLPKQGFVFCCFNNSFKITPAVFASWMRILRAVEGSVLWLLADNPAMQKSLRAEAVSRSVDPDRLVFAPRVTITEHLARHFAADLFLDTTPYNAHTTASDALWMGLPLVTRLGESFPARVAASLLNAANLAELVTRTEAEYEALAIGLATDRARLARLRTRLEQQRTTSPLFDTVNYARHLESAFATMVTLQRSGVSAHDIRPCLASS
jgi:predicted O-linked N-acetylglucosamine transferase (SPINDLY family)